MIYSLRSKVLPLRICFHWGGGGPLGKGGGIGRGVHWEGGGQK